MPDVVTVPPVMVKVPEEDMSMPAFCPRKLLLSEEELSPLVAIVQLVRVKLPEPETYTASVSAAEAEIVSLVLATVPLLRVYVAFVALASETNTIKQVQNAAPMRVAHREPPPRLRGKG